MCWNINLLNAYYFVSPQSDAIAIHYRPLGLRFAGEHRFDQITREKKTTPRFFNSVQFHELTLIDSGLPLSSWLQSITSSACAECNTATS